MCEMWDASCESKSYEVENQQMIFLNAFAFAEND